MFVVGLISTLMFLCLAIMEEQNKAKEKHRKADFWIWLIITMISAQYIWG